VSLKTEFLTQKLAAYLDRKAVPNSLQSKPSAQEAEIRALVVVLTRSAPDSDEGIFWESVERELDENATSRAWPTVSELRKACLSVRPKRSKSAPNGDAVDTFAINAGRIERGEAVGDEWLYGRLSVELVARGLATEARLDAYRSGLFFAMRDVWGEERARQVEAEFRDKHRAAQEMAKATGEIPKISFRRMEVAE
jgi:hypothetical protein